MKKLIYGIITGGVVAGGATLAVLSTAGTARADEASVSAPAGISTTLGLGQSVVDETVYVFLNEDGSVRKTISSDWSKNDLGADTYTKTEGKVATPIEVAISYYLDGKKVSADEIRGRSGHVKIRYEYTNTERVNGMYMPYAVLSGAVLSNEKFSNITVTNGRLMNDGSRTAVVGVTLPGMKENLGVDVDLPEYFEIEADAKEFKMEMTATLATSKVFAELDVSALDSIDSLSGQLDTLASSMTQLMDGSVQLRDGLATLNDSTGALVDGATKLRAGSLKLVEGASNLSDGLLSAYSGSKELASGLSSALDGAKTLGSGISDAYTGAVKLDAGVDQLVASLDDLVEGFTALNADNANTKLISGAKQLFDGTIDALKTSLSTITADNYETVLSGAIAQATEAAKQAAAAGATDQAAEYQAKATALSTSLAQLSLYDGVQKYVAGVDQIAAGAAGAPAKVTPLKNGASALASGLKTMSEKTPELQSGLSDLSSGATSLSSGLSSAYGGSKELATGMASLDAGLSNLSSNVPALTEGVAKLYQGSGNLSDGLSKFNEEGVQKLISLYNGNVKTLVNKVQNMVSIAKDSGSKVKYIYRTPEI